VGEALLGEPLADLVGRQASVAEVADEHGSSDDSGDDRDERRLCVGRSRVDGVRDLERVEAESAAAAFAMGAPIVAVFETHVQADHVSGLPELVARAGATAYLPADTGVKFEHVALADGDVVELGNTLVTAITTPGHAPAHHAYTVADRRRGTEEPWLVFSGDSLLIGDVGRPDLHVAGDAGGQARLLHASLRRLLE